LFAPTKIGTTQWSMRIDDNAPGSPHSATISATGYVVAVTPQRPGRPSRSAAEIKLRNTSRQDDAQ
jgi:hypothetical protein